MKICVKIAHTPTHAKKLPIRASLKLKRWIRNSPKNEMKNPKPMLKRNDVRKIVRRSGIAYALAILAIPLSSCIGTWRMCLLVSSNCSSTCVVLAAASIAANQNGVDALNHDTTDGSASTPPRNGPTMKPTPKAAPIRPKFLVRSSGLVTSAIDACATERLPPVMPSSARARNSSGMFLMTMPVANSA